MCTVSDISACETKTWFNTPENCKVSKQYLNEWTCFEGTYFEWLRSNHIFYTVHSHSTHQACLLTKKHSDQAAAVLCRVYQHIDPVTLRIRTYTGDRYWSATIPVCRPELYPGERHGGAQSTWTPPNIAGNSAIMSLLQGQLHRWGIHWALTITARYVGTQQTTGGQERAVM